eukprot:744702_1
MDFSLVIQLGGSVSSVNESPQTSKTSEISPTEKFTLSDSEVRCGQRVRRVRRNERVELTEISVPNDGASITARCLKSARFTCRSAHTVTRRHVRHTRASEPQSSRAVKKIATLERASSESISIDDVPNGEIVENS